MKKLLLLTVISFGVASMGVSFDAEAAGKKGKKAKMTKGKKQADRKKLAGEIRGVFESVEALRGRVEGSDALLRDYDKAVGYFRPLKALVELEGADRKTLEERIMFGRGPQDLTKLLASLKKFQVELEGENQNQAKAKAQAVVSQKTPAALETKPLKPLTDAKRYAKANDILTWHAKIRHEGQSKRLEQDMRREYDAYMHDTKDLKGNFNPGFVVKTHDDRALSDLHTRTKKLHKKITS